jgi:hypothetical protein
LTGIQVLSEKITYFGRERCSLGISSSIGFWSESTNKPLEKWMVSQLKNGKGQIEWNTIS